MFDITKLALKIPNFLTNKECNELINEFEQRNDEIHKEVSRNYHTDNIEESSFDVIPLNPITPNFNLIKEKTKLAVNEYTEYLSKPNYFFTSLLKQNLLFSHSYRIMKYKEGASIHAHSDYEPFTYASVTFNLNEDYKGGEFKFFNGNYTVPLKKGDALIFPADYFWIHEVTPVIKGNRYSINSFIRSYPEIVCKNLQTLQRALANDYINHVSKDELLGPYN